MKPRKFGCLQKVVTGYYLKYYFEPEFVFRPTQIFRHLGYALNPSRREFLNVELPWGSNIRVRQNEYIGRNIRNKGLYDIVICEAIWRLLDAGERAVDVGANIGQMTSLMAARVGTRGKVFAFEPHPEIFEELKHNVFIGHCGASVSVEKMALGDHDGEAVLGIPENFTTNRGMASLMSDNLPADAARPGEVVQLRRLDHIVGQAEPVGLIKIDVEGHELGVLEGATGLFDSGGARDILFEDHAADPFETPVSCFLRERSYSLFYLQRDIFGLRVGDLKHGKRELKGAAYYNCLATTDPERALVRLGGKGWAVLKSTTCAPIA